MQALLAPLGELADYQEILKVRKKEDGIIQIAGCVGSQKTHLMYALGDGFEYRSSFFPVRKSEESPLMNIAFLQTMYTFILRVTCFFIMQISRETCSLTAGWEYCVP